jgi:hypothetical protein
MLKREIILNFAAVFLVLVSLGLVSSQDISVNSILIKVSVNGGDSVSKSISISSESGGEFNLNIVNLNGVSVDEDRFYLNAKESKEVMITFNSRGINYGPHVGSIKILGPKEEYMLPVIFEVESKDPFFDLNLDIPPQYTSVAPGESVLSQIKIFDLVSGGTTDGLGATNLDIEYFIYDAEGQVVSSQTEGVVLDKEAQVNKLIPIPESIDEGSYVMAAVIKNGNSVSVSSKLFDVRRDKSESFFGTSDSNFVIILVFIAVLFFSMLIFFVYIMRDRDKLFLELRKYNANELKKQEEFLDIQARVAKSRTTSKEKIRKIEEQVRLKRKLLKAKQEKRVSEFRSLKKRGKKDEMRKKLDEWKEKGYDTTALEYKLGMLSKKDMNEILKKWKKY